MQPSAWIIMKRERETMNLLHPLHSSWDAPTSCSGCSPGCCSWREHASATCASYVSSAHPNKCAPPHCLGEGERERQRGTGKQIWRLDRRKGPTSGPRCLQRPSGCPCAHEAP